MSFDPLSLEGARAVVALFGAWPRFHDAEVIDVYLKRNETCRLSIHTFTMTSQIDNAGHYRTVNHGIVTFEINEICSLLLKNFNRQNVLFDLEISHEDDGAIRLDMSASYGLEGFISGRNVRVLVEAGMPSDSIYKREVKDS